MPELVGQGDTASMGLASDETPEREEQLDAEESAALQMVARVRAAAAAGGPPTTTCFAARERRRDTSGYIRRARGDQQRRPLGGRSQPRPDLDSHHIDAMHSQVERSLAHADAALATMLQNAAVLHQCTSDDAFYLYLSQWHSRGRLTEPNPIIYLRAVRHSAGGPHVQRHRLPGPRLQYLSRPERRRALEFRGATGLVLPCDWIG